MTALPRNLAMKRKITLAVLVTSTACLIAACVALFLIQIRSFRRTFVSDLSAIGDVIATSSAAHVAFKDADPATEVLDSLRAKPDVVSASILTKDGTLLAHFGEPDDAAIQQKYPPENGFVFSQDYLLHTKPIILDDERIGTLHLRSNYRSVYQSRLRLYSGILALVLIVCVLLAVVVSARLKLENQIKELQREISERERAESQLEEAHTQLVETSRHAGMAEVATGVLHNVGNVLNSVNVSANLVSDRVRGSKAENLLKVADLLREHADHLEDFFTSDPRGKLLLDYLPNLGAHLNEERSDMLQEIELLTKNLDHIKEIVAMQQSYARVSGVVEPVSITSLVEDALQINAAALNRHGVEVIRNYADVPVIIVDKHKVLQILVNLIRNAKYAMEECGQDHKQLVVGIETTPGGCVRVAVKDNGQGILPENLVRIFSHGFTTKKDGHGFGLHTSALAASEMQGSLSAYSDGLGTGAIFTLELPLAPT
jgi:signal transduction histidine kinase